MIDMRNEKKDGVRKEARARSKGLTGGWYRRGSSSRGGLTGPARPPPRTDNGARLGGEEKKGNKRRR